MIEIPRIVQGAIEKQIAMVDAEGRMIPELGAEYNLAQGLALIEGKVSSRDLMAELLKDVEEKHLVLFEDDNVVVYAEDAPMFPYEVVIRAKRLGANSLIYLMPQEASSFAKALEVVRRMYLAIKVQDLAIVDESAQYDNPSSCWRYAIRLMPRRVAKKVKRLTALDIKGIYLVPVSPEKAAAALMKVLTGKRP
jgi:galactose-1-phosphate uridylyltransferase